MFCQLQPTSKATNDLTFSYFYHIIMFTIILVIFTFTLNPIESSTFVARFNNLYHINFYKSLGTFLIQYEIYIHFRYGMLKIIQNTSTEAKIFVLSYYNLEFAVISIGLITNTVLHSTSEYTDKDTFVFLHVFPIITALPICSPIN